MLDKEIEYYVPDVDLQLSNEYLLISDFIQG